MDFRKNGPLSLLPIKKLSELIHADLLFELEETDKFSIIGRMCKALEGHPQVHDAKVLHEAMIKREEIASTAVGNSIAIPHVKIPEVDDYILVVGRHREGLDFGAADGKPVHLVFMLAASDKQAREFVRMLAKVTHLLKDPETREQLTNAPLPDGFLQIVIDYESR